MNNHPMQIFVDNDTAMMIQAFTDVGVSIDFDKLLELMGLIIAWTALGLFVGCWVGNTVNKN
ncbi:hypothetical protein ABZ242_002600 [Escherichia coli]